MPPTQFQNLSKIFKIVFPGNWTKTLYSQNQHSLLNQIQLFEMYKSVIEKIYADS